MTKQERRLGVCLRVFAFMSLAYAALYASQGIWGESEFPFTANSIAKDGLFAIIALIGAADVRRHDWAPVTIVIGHVVIVVALLGMLALGHDQSIAHTLEGPLPLPEPRTLLLGWTVAAGGIALAFFLLRRSALRARHDLRYLGPLEFLTLASLSEVLIEGEMAVPPLEVAGNTERYLRDFDAEGKWRIRLALGALALVPLLTLHAPFPVMSAENRRAFLRKRFVGSVTRRWLPGPLRDVQQSMIRAAAQMAYIGYYRDPRSYAECDYLPFERRPERLERLVATPSPPRPRLECMLPGNVHEGWLAADVAIIGSGAAGATLAHGLAAKGREVLLIERGPHVDPSQFAEDEATQLSRLYRDGALTLARDFRFQVLQGMCVGGSTVINNAVCFDLPDRFYDRWNDDEHEADLDVDRLRASFRRLRQWLPIVAQDDAERLNPGFRPFEAGVRGLGLDRAPFEFGVVDANLHDCVGCGNCNSGCPYGRKLSMLDRTLPDAQRRYGSDAVRILAEAQVLEILHDGRSATGVRCRLSDGRTIDVRANTVVVSAGALASSVLLRRSGIGGDRVGDRLAFNLASPIVADLPDPLHSERGLQISHYLRAPGDGVALETWFMPLLGMSLFMPGWFEDHLRNMRRYGHLTAVGVVVGSEGNARVRPSRLNRRGIDLDYKPSARDLKLMLQGIKLASTVMLEGGAERVMPATFAFNELRHRDQLDGFVKTIRDNSDLSINSAHPQGGNPISRNPAKGVVDPTLRVHGWDNLFVCDASVFPTSITVNPQLTVMALADYAVEHVA